MRSQPCFCSASAADRTVQLELDASSAACTAWDQMDCSYLEARNGNAPAPDPQTDAEPTFLNLALLAEPVTIDATLHDDGTVTIPEGSVNFPAYPTTMDNDLVGEVTIEISINQTADWTGTFDAGTGEMSLTAPLGLQFNVSCDATDTEHALCAGAFGAEGNMGTWQVDTTGPVDPLTTGHLDAPAPPAAYGPDWLGPVVEDGSPLDAGTGKITLINNDLVVNPVSQESCIDETSAACTNAGLGGLLLDPLNDALGTTDNAEEPAFMDSQPGAIDMRLAMVMTEEPPPAEGFSLTFDNALLDFGIFEGLNPVSSGDPITVEGDVDENGALTVAPGDMVFPSTSFDEAGMTGTVSFAATDGATGLWDATTGLMKIRSSVTATVAIDGGDTCTTTQYMRFSTSRMAPYRGKRFTEGLDGPGAVSVSWDNLPALEGGAQCDSLSDLMTGPGGMWAAHDMAAPLRDVPVVEQAPVLTTSIATGMLTPATWNVGWQLRCDDTGTYSNDYGNPWIGVVRSWNVPDNGNKTTYVSNAGDAGETVICSATATNVFGSTVANSNGIELE